MHDRLSSLEGLQTHTFEVNIWRYIYIYIYISVPEKQTAYLWENKTKEEMFKSQLKSSI